MESIYEFYIVEHNPNLFALMSRVTIKDLMGRKRTYTNFVAEATTKEEIERMKSLVDN